MTNTPQFVGIVATNEHLYVALWPASERWQSANDAQGITEVMTRLGEFDTVFTLVGGSDVEVLPLVGELVAAGIGVTVVDLSRIRGVYRVSQKGVRDGKERRPNTRVLARLAAKVHPTASPVPDELRQAMRALSEQRRGVALNLDEFEAESMRLDQELSQALRDSPVWLEERPLLESASGGPNRWLRWLGLASTITSLLVVITSALLFFVIPEQLQLVVWVKDRTTLYPPEEGPAVPLPLSYDETVAETAVSFNANVSNLGKEVIGSQHQLWRLDIASPSASHMLMIGEIRKKPGNLVVEVADNCAINFACLNLGALEPKAEVEFELVVLNTPDIFMRDIEANSSLNGLPDILVTRSSLRGRISDRIFIPWAIGAVATAALVYGVLLLYGSFSDIRRLWGVSKPRLAFEALKWSVLYIVMGGIAVAVAAAGISFAVGWIVTTFFI